MFESTERLMRSSVVAVVLLLGWLTITVNPVAAQGSGLEGNETVVVGGTQISWTGNWEAEDQSEEGAQQALFTLVDPTSGAFKIVTYSVVADDSIESVDQAVDAFAEGFAGGIGAEDVVENGSGELEDGTVWKIFTFDFQSIQVSFLITATQNDDGAFVITSVLANTTAMVETIEQVQSDFTVNSDGSLLEGIDATEVTDSDDMSVIGEIELPDLPKIRSGESQPDAASTSVPSSGRGGLSVLSITTKDAGIGDGSMYAYVEVVNQSGQLYSYVGLDGTCRDSSGGIVGTGIGNTANVAPGETVVITMIFFAVPGCTDVDVRFDALTGL